MENPSVENFISSLAQSLKPGYPEFINTVNLSECSKEIDSLLSDTSKGSVLRCLLLNFHRQTNIVCQSKTALEKEIESLKAQNASLISEIQIANHKVLRYLEDLHSADSQLFSHKKELLGLRSETLAPPKSFSHADSGLSNANSSINERLTPSPELTREVQSCSTSSLHHFESDDRASIVSPSQTVTSQCPRLEELELLAKDMDVFDPDNCDHNIEDHFRELDQNLIDLPNAIQREKVKFVWKTSSKAVRKVIQSQPARVRNDYNELRHALTEEFASTADEIASLVAASQIKHSRQESPRDYYRRLRHVYFQGKNAPGLEENPTFKSLYLQNLHPCIRTHVILETRKDNLSLNEVRKIAQVAWETVVNCKARETTSASSSSNTVRSHRPSVSEPHPQNRSKGGDKTQHRDAERKRHVRQLPRDSHAQSRSCRRPYSEILAQHNDLPNHCSDDDHSISDRSSEPDSDSASECLSVHGYRQRYSPEPRVKKNFKQQSSRVRSSRFCR